MSHFFLGPFQLGGSHSHLTRFVLWNDGMMQRRIFWNTCLKKELPRFLDTNEKYHRIKSCHGANKKTTYVEIYFIIAVGQPFNTFQCFKLKAH